MSHKKRVLLWQETFLPAIGGVEVLAPKLLSGLRELGYEFSVVTRDDDVDGPTETRWDGILVHRCPFAAAFMTGNIEQLARIRSYIVRLKRTFAPDLVHLNLFGPSALLHHDTVRAHPAPLLLTLHATEHDMQLQSYACDGLFRQTLRSAQWVSCVSSAVLSYWGRIVPDIRGCSSVIYNGFPSSDPPTESASPQQPSLLCVGRLAPEKGVDLAIAAFAAISSRFPTARLVIAGDGPERGNLERQVRNLNLTHAVEFIGWVRPDKVMCLLDAATLVIMPSRIDAFPSVAVEAALRERPIVATKVGGIPEIVEDGETGLLAEANNVSALTQAIEHLLKYPQIAIAFGCAARQRAQERFNFEHYVANYDALYQRLIN